MYKIGHKHSKEIKEKMRLAKLGKSSGMLNKHHSEETKQKLSIANKGKHLSEQTKLKMSKTKTGQKRFNFMGKNNPNWQGGISFELYTVNWTTTLKRSIRERDHYTCQICRKEPSTHCHHIDYDKHNCNPDNLITLCLKCHGKTNYNRKKWIKFLGFSRTRQASGNVL